MNDARVAVYQTVRILPEHERPCCVFRKDGKTILAMDPRDTRMDICLVVATQLHPDEFAYYCEAFGCGPNGEDSPPEYTSDDRTCLLYVPAPLRLHGEPALQGGVVLERRLMADDLNEELLLLNREWQSQAG